VSSEEVTMRCTPYHCVHGACCLPHGSVPGTCVSWHYTKTGAISLTVLQPGHHWFSWIATRLWYGQTGVRKPVKEGEVSLLQNVQTNSGDHPASYSMGTGFFPEGKSGQGVMSTTHFHLTPRFRQCSDTSTSLFACVAWSGTILPLIIFPCKCHAVYDLVGRFDSKWDRWAISLT
jgi:hypothetical protein